MQLPEYTHHSCTITTGYDAPCIRLEINDYVIEIFCLGNLKNEKDKKHINWMVLQKNVLRAASCLGEGKARSVKKAKKKAEAILREAMAENILPG